MASIQWSAPSAWADAFAAANFNALADGSGILSTATAVDNSTTRYLYCEVSFETVTSTFTPTTDNAHLAFYVLPLLHGGTLYPNNANGTTVATQPSIDYLKSTIHFGTTALAHSGMSARFDIPLAFKFYVINRCGVPLPSSATNMTCRYRMFEEEVV